MKHPALFTWLTRLSRFACWVLLLTAILWAIDISEVVFLGADFSTIDRLEIEDAAAIPMFASGILLLFNRIRAAFASFILFFLGALAIELSITSVLICVVFGLLLFSPLTLVHNQRMPALEKEQG
jgi:hypothetical protein